MMPEELSIPIDVVLVAAGQSQRFTQGGRSKIFQRLGDRTVLEHSIHALLRHPAIRADRLQVVINQAYATEFAELPHLPKGLRPYCLGGDSRAKSVRLGLDALRDEDAKQQPNRCVLIHDAARPNISEGLLSRLIEGLQKHEAVIPILPINDALKHHDAYLRSAHREEYCLSQTPQAFHLSSLEEAYSKMETQLSSIQNDEASLFYVLARPIHTIAGDPQNIKTTYPEDLAYLRRLMLQTLYGTGFDLHRFDVQQSLSDHTIKIAGCDVAHPHALIGHSDGDVVIHALCDAIYGCLADGDIGQHFPPSEARWKDQDSALFLHHALDKLNSAGGRLFHLDATIIADRPKIQPIRDKLRQKLATLCGLSVDHISIKATTTEGLGFIEAKHAIAAQIMISVEMPLSIDRMHP